MNLRSLTIAVFAGSSLVACAGSAPEKNDDQAAQMACEQGVREKFKDPESVQFRDVTVAFQGDATPIDIIDESGQTRENVPGRYWNVTGEVNAKNGFGAYTGFSSFKCEANLREGDAMAAGYINVDN